MGVSVTHYVVAGLLISDSEMEKLIKSDQDGWDDIMDYNQDGFQLIQVSPMSDYGCVFGKILAKGDEYDGTELTGMPVDQVESAINHAKQNIPEFLQGAEYSAGLWAFTQYR